MAVWLKVKLGTVNASASMVTTETTVRMKEPLQLPEQLPELVYPMVMDPVINHV